jgi:hypothetical protein
MFGNLGITQAEPALSLALVDMNPELTFSRTQVLLITPLLITYFDGRTIPDKMLSSGITDSTDVIPRWDSGTIRICLGLLGTQTDIVVGLLGQLCETGPGEAYRIADLADVTWGWLIWISSVRGILCGLVGAFLDPVLQVSCGSNRYPKAYPWFLTYTTNISFRDRSFIYTQLGHGQRH